MAITYQDGAGNLRQITLTGRLDILGTAEIELPLTTLSAAADRRVVLDISEVTFLASIGIRAIVSSAKALYRRGGKMVLLVGTNEAISKTLQTTGIDLIVPMFASAEDAVNAAMSA